MSNSNRTLLAYTREPSFRGFSAAVLTAAGVQGTVPLFDWRFSAAGIVHNKGTVESDEINDDRMSRESIAISVDANGQNTHEFCCEDFDDVVNAVMQCNYQLIVSATCTVSGQTITADSGTPFGPLIGAKFIKILLAATAGNNGVKQVVSITDSVITLAAGSLSGSDSADAMTFYLNEYSVIDSVTVTVTGTGTIYTATVGTFSTTTQGARYVKMAGGTLAAASQGIRKVVSCTSTVLTLAAPTTGTDEVGKTATVTARYTRVGTTQVSHVIQRTFADLAVPEYTAFTGMCVDGVDINAAARSKVGFLATFMGYKGQSRTASVNTATPTAASTNSIVQTSDNIGSILVDGSAAANPVKSINWSCKNNLRSRPVVGDAGTLEPGVGESVITGQMEAYFTDNTLLAKYINHTAAAIEYKITDADGNVFNIYLPSVKFNGGDVPIPGINQDIMQTLPFKAHKDATLGYHCQIDRLAT